MLDTHVVLREFGSKHYGGQEGRCRNEESAVVGRLNTLYVKGERDQPHEGLRHERVGRARCVLMAFTDQVLVRIRLAPDCRSILARLGT